MSDSPVGQSGVPIAERAARAMAVRGWDRARPETQQIYLRQARLVEAAGLLRSEETMMPEMTTSPCPCCDGTGDASPKTDAQVLAALMSQVPSNPSGCSAIDALIGLGYYGNVTAALARLVTAGKLRETSPGNYLPVEA